MGSSIEKHFATLNDPRVEGRTLHSLLDIIILTITAVASGAEGWEAIEDFGKEKLAWLRQYIALENGVPSHDCIAYVLSRISVQGFQNCFLSWTRSVVTATAGEIIAIDGKTARGSCGRQKRTNPLHMVSAWACQNRLVLGQQATEDKSNEITAIPKLLALLELKGAIVTLDAMGCQKSIAQQIIEQEGNYVLGLKGNHSKLHKAVADFFQTARTAAFEGIDYAYHEEIDKDHGRLEIRRYWVSSVLSSLPDTAGWKGLKSIGMVERECLSGEGQRIEQRYFINSIPTDAKRFAQAVRGHWGIENRLHWRLDVVLGDDACRIREDRGATIMTSIRQLCMNLFQQEGSALSLAKKKRKAAWSDSYRAKLLFS